MKKEFNQKEITISVPIYTDKNGDEIQIGDMIKTTVNVKSGERKDGKHRYNTYQDIEVVFTVSFRNFGNGCWWFISTDQTVSYKTGFYSGVGRLKSERDANESVAVTDSLNRVLNEFIAAKSEIVKPTTP